MSNNTWVCRPEQEDGFGSQFQHIIACILFSRHYNMEYVHRPLELVEHNYDNNSKFVENLNSLIKIKSTYRRLNEVPSIEYKNKCTQKNFKKLLDMHVDEWLQDPVLDELRDVFKPPKREYVHVAIHVRKTNKQDNRHVFDQDDDIIALMHTLAKDNIQFHIYSQGDQANFQKFLVFPGIKWHLNEDITTTFRDMVNADILIIAKSSLSYAAALLNKGMIYYQPFWHAFAAHWKRF